MWASVLLVPDSSGVKHYFVSQVLPFGASASVFAFNRIARAIHAIGTRLFALVWSNYYDDYPQLDLHACGDSAMQAAERLMDLLGWRFSKKPTRRLSMAKSLDALGVVFDMEYSQSCRIVVRNKPSRVEQIRNDIDMILESGRFSTAVAMSLRGRLQFAESQTFGRAVMLHMRTCHQRAVGCVTGNMLTDSMMSELFWAKQFVLSCPPRILKGHVHDDRVLIFTDACLEDSNQIAGVGMVAYVWRGSKLAHKFFFSEKVPPGLLKHLQRDTPRVIAALELMAAVMAIECLAHHLNAVRAFLFIDNEAARANLISMTSPVLVQAELLKELYQLAAKTSLFMWVSRVPSSSNMADRPSRFEVDLLLQQGFTQPTPSWPRE